MFILSFFFFNDTATTEIYTLSLHDALPISLSRRHGARGAVLGRRVQQPVHPLRQGLVDPQALAGEDERSEEHTSELQSLAYLVCRLLLEKKKNPLSGHDNDVDCRKMTRNGF